MLLCRREPKPPSALQAARFRAGRATTARAFPSPWLAAVLLAAPRCRPPRLPLPATSAVYALVGVASARGRLWCSPRRVPARRVNITQAAYRPGQGAGDTKPIRPRRSERRDELKDHPAARVRGGVTHATVIWLLTFGLGQPSCQRVVWTIAGGVLMGAPISDAGLPACLGSAVVLDISFRLHAEEYISEVVVANAPDRRFGRQFALGESTASPSFLFAPC